MMRAEAIRRVGGYRQQWQHSEDLDLFLRLAEIGKLHNLPEYLLQYRMHYESANHLRHEEQRALKQKLMEEAYARRGEAGEAENHTGPLALYLSAGFAIVREDGDGGAVVRKTLARR